MLIRWNSKKSTIGSESWWKSSMGGNWVCLVEFVEQVKAYPEWPWYVPGRYLRTQYIPIGMV